MAYDLTVEQLDKLKKFAAARDEANLILHTLSDTSQMAFEISEMQGKIMPDHVWLIALLSAATLVAKSMPHLHKQEVLSMLETVWNNTILVVTPDLTNTKH